MSNFDDALNAERAKLLQDDGQGNQPTPDTSRAPVMSMADTLTRLQRAAEQARQRNLVYLPDLSAAYSLSGTNVKIEAAITDVPVDAMLASGSIPVGVRRLLNELIKRSEDATKDDRDRMGMLDLAKQIAADEYGGDVAATAGDAIQLQWVVACMGVSNFMFNGEPNDPVIQLVLDRNDASGLWIGTLSDRDRHLIVDATWQRVEEEAQAAESFPEPRNAPETLATVGAQRQSSERATDV